MAISRTAAGAHSNSGAHNTTPADVTDEGFTRLAVSIACILYIVGYAGYSFEASVPFLRYIIYAIPAILVAPLLFQHTLRINGAASILLASYILMGFLGYFLNVEHLGSFFSSFIIINLVIISFVPIINVSAKQICIIFYGTLIYLAAILFLTKNGGVRFFELLSSGAGSGVGEGLSISQGLLGPLYATFFCATGATSPFWLALVMTILGGKRVGLLALIIGLIFVFLFKKTALFKKKLNRIIALLATLAIISIVGLRLVPIAESLHQHLQIEPSIEEVMLGRYHWNLTLTNAIDKKPLIEWLFGSGANSADELTGDDLPHNDWLMLFFDYGLVGLIAFIVFMALIFSSSTTGAAIAVVVAITMITDNVMIYLFYQLPVVFMISYAARRESRR